MNNSFFGFSTKSFEQFVQALAAHVLGPGIVVFGSGPDGGREATFEGVIGYPFETDQWDGYGVIQAKCKEKTEGTDIDQQWALKQLKSELERFVGSKKRKKKPEFYIFATNVTLTPVSESGGKDKADKLIRSYYDKLSLKGHRIWDSDQITTFLDAYEELRRRFSVQLTSGDVLARLAVAIESTQPDFTLIATSFLDRQLRDDEDARLDQAGQRIDQRTALARVFVDLPVESQPSENPPDEEGTESLTKGFLHELIESGSRKLDPKSLRESKREKEPGELLLWNETSRWVLIGGPGSGKSTLSQFLAQVHRASILDRREPHKITSECKAIIAQIRDLCTTDGIPWPATPRFPFRIELSSFARALASENRDEKARSLLEYLTIRMRGSRNLRTEDVLNWLSRYPILLILDGLDEVPASSNRDALCSAIQDFFAETTQVNADILTLATTRPAGYNEEFGKESFEYRYLPPLAIQRSLLYAHRFAEARFGTRSARVEEMSQRLLEASRDELTARLMRTPLQVTFMATLVAAGGRPPRDRWKLFRDYYDTIYKREQQKSDGELRAVLDNHDTLIHRVHHDVGFLLQVHGENAGATDAMMPLETFSQVVKRYLGEDGWGSPDLEQIAMRISDEARTRLVFLTSRVAGQVSFDVRSLQEYMAGECIMTGAESRLHERLATIAPLAYWRNVFLFTAGQCFAVPQLQHLRALIHQVCEEMNDAENDPVMGVTHSGSRLAVDLLEDGTVTNTPNFARAFARLALRLLQSPGVEAEFEPRPPMHVRLYRIYEPRLDSVYQQMLSPYFASSTAPNVRAWGILFGLLARNVEWARKLADRCWPSGEDEQLAILSVALAGNLSNEWLVQRLIEVVPRTAPKKLRFHELVSFGAAVPKWLSAALSMSFYGRFEELASLRLAGLGKGVLGLSFDPVFSESEPTYWEALFALREMPSPSAGWLPFVAAANFLETPTKESLAGQLKMLGENGRIDTLNEVRGFPWPFQACLQSVKEQSDLVSLAERVRNGDLGDAKEWRAAERRWVDDGITLEDLSSYCETTLPFDKTIGVRGFPCARLVNWTESGIPRCNITSVLLEALEATEDLQLRSSLRRFIFSNLISRRRAEDSHHPLVPAVKWRNLCEEERPLNLNLLAVTQFVWPEKLEPEWLEFFEWLGNSESTLQVVRRQAKRSVIPEQLAAAYTVNPELNGVLRVLGQFAIAGYPVSIPERLLGPTRFADARFQLAAILLLLCQGSLNSIENYVETLVRIEKMEPKLKAVHLALRTVTLPRGAGREIETFVLSLRRQLVGTSTELVTECDEALLWLLRRRNSNLNDRTRAEQLGLPWARLE